MSVNREERTITYIDNITHEKKTMVVKASLRPLNSVVDTKLIEARRQTTKALDELSDARRERKRTTGRSTIKGRPLYTFEPQKVK